MSNFATDLLNEMIHIAAWKVTGMVINQEDAIHGDESAVRVLVQTSPTDKQPRWFHLEAGQYSIV